MEKMNTVLRKSTPQLVAAKQNCSDEDGSRRCHYRSSSGPGINMISNGKAAKVQAIVIVDQRGMSPAGGVYLGAIMEAFDTSLDENGRKRFFNDLVGEFVKAPGKATTQKNSDKLKYVLSANERFLIIGVSHVK